MKKFCSVILMVAVTASAVFAQNVEIVNSYENTEELIQKFTVVNPSVVNNQMERNIQNRPFNRF